MRTIREVRETLNNLTQPPGGFDSLESFPENSQLQDLTPTQLAEYAAFFFGFNSAGNVIEQNTASIASHQLLLTRIALERAQLDGLSPLQLDELVPNYLETVPQDPFDGTPLKFDPERRLVYSVGRDRIDNNGITEKPGDLKDGQELVITLPIR